MELNTKRKLRILTLPTGRDGCSWYRVKQPYNAIGEAGIAEVVIANPGDKDLHRLVEYTDVVIARPNQEQLVENIRALKYEDLKIIFDIDDDIWDINPYSPVYKDIGLCEVKEGDKWVWQNGRDFDHTVNRRRLTKIENAVKLADIITTTTPRLALKIKEKFPDSKVAVVPNSIDFNIWKPIEIPKDDIRVGWSGGASHKVDWETIAEPLNEVLYKFPKAVFVSSGAEWRDMLTGIMGRGQYEFNKWVDISAHPYKSALNNLDIAVIPLKDIPFNHSKSCIKWYEFSALKVPCLVARVSPYADEIDHGNTGFLYSDEKEFKKYLEQLIKDRELREYLAENAYDWVKEHRDLNDVKNYYAQVFDKIY
jgi:glycosyltransferase involved in cell wall biosynthesis